MSEQAGLYALQSAWQCEIIDICSSINGVVLGGINGVLISATGSGRNLTVVYKQGMQTLTQRFTVNHAGTGIENQQMLA